MDEEGIRDRLGRITRFEEIKDAKKGTPEYREMLLLVHLISSYEEKKWSLPDVDPIEMIKIRMEDFGIH